MIIHSAVIDMIGLDKHDGRNGESDFSRIDQRWSIEAEEQQPLWHYNRAYIHLLYFRRRPVILMSTPSRPIASVFGFLHNRHSGAMGFSKAGEDDCTT